MLERCYRTPFLITLLHAIRLFFITAFFLATPFSVVHAQEDFLAPEKAFVFSAAIAGPSELQVHFAIAPDYYMYRERFEIDGLPGAEATPPPAFPPGKVVYDPTFDKNMEVYYDQVTVRIPLPEPDIGANYQVAITSQGCADAGLCYPPRTDTIVLEAGPGGYQASGPGVRDSVPSSAYGETSPSGGQPEASVFNLGDTGLARWLVQAGWLEVVGLSIVFGVLLTLTPCVLPMVPIVLAVVMGDARQSGNATRWRGFSLAASYVLGMSLVYTALGVVAGLLGASLAVWLQTPWVLSLFAIVLGILALAMFDVFSFQTPGAVQSRLGSLMNRLPGGRFGGAFFMGMVSALIVGPCVAAPLAGVLMFISQTGNYVLGGSALFAMAWGQGLLLLVVGASSGALLPRAGAWMEGVKRFFGVLLFATAWWMVSSVVPGAVFMLGWAFLAMWTAVLLNVFGPLTLPESLTGFPRLLHTLLKTAGLLLAIWALVVLVGVSAGSRDVLRPLAPFSSTAGSQTGGAVVAGPEFRRVQSVAQLDQALANAGRPVMLDFYADWCVSCIEMERFTFTDPEVAALMGQFELLQADVTANTLEDRELLKRFQLFGPPGILFFDAHGKPLDDLRVIGFKKARPFAAVLQQALRNQQ